MRVYQTPRTETMTVLTSEQIAVVMSKPTDKALTIKQKADLLQDEMMWSRIDGQPFALDCTSPTSGNVYRLTLIPFTGQVRCDCKAKGHCKHIECFNRDWKALLMAQVTAPAAPVKPSVYSAYVAPRPTISEAQYSADWDV